MSPTPLIAQPVNLHSLNDRVAFVGPCHLPKFWSKKPITSILKASKSSVNYWLFANRTRKRRRRKRRMSQRSDDAGETRTINTETGTRGTVLKNIILLIFGGH